MSRSIAEIWRDAGPAGRARVVFGLTGYLLMATAIIFVFGYWGFVFIIGYVMSDASKTKPERTGGK